MPEESNPAHDSMIPAQPIPADARAFSSRISGLLDGQPKDEAAVNQALEGMDDIVDQIAAGLYNLASMLVGEGEDSIKLVETAIATTEVSVCHDPVEARKNSRKALCGAAIAIIGKRGPTALVAPEGLAPVETCLDDDDLDSAGVTREDLERVISGPDRARVKNWLTGLPTAVRTIFVLRAVASMSAVETADLLADHGGPQAAGWTPDAVREIFRRGLCSLASQLIQATAAH
jgi:hypothetical protein